ncbi:cystathionine gamma-synthase [Betaproteobacteria bacterium]|nr:cystathionine gamma-synthase [Betaproteobacteria bacterium]GHT98336.1 cystathionine gamma-synthase [Betaproteobacteria bacterium]GHU09684.1 cystathionine gamma-synthase [Betaproteobacteria bacterium]GHU23359.1 cystathionine gamma-synthase [Betaproteobacteria bacterium]
MDNYDFLLDAQTLAVHGDLDRDSDGLDDTALAPAIYPASTYSARTSAEFAEMANTPRHSRYYARYGNPTQERCERLLARLEGVESALLFSSGMGAISTTLLALLDSGDHVVAQSAHYMGTSQLFTKLLPGMGVEVTRVDQRDSAAFANAVRDNTKLIVVETPSNPTLTLTDLAAIGELGRSRKILTVADNTFASPINQRPRDFGIDLVLHSATKYLGGHSDLIAGVVCGDQAVVEKIWEYTIMLGTNPSPFNAFLLLRGLRTLPIRVARQNENALTLARFLERHPAIARVHYPELDSHPQRALAQRQMRHGGGVLSIELAGGDEGIAGGFAAAKRFVASLKLARHAVSLGGVETLVVHAASMWEASLTPEEMERSGISPTLVRIAAGLENAQDLCADVEQALRAPKS